MPAEADFGRFWADSGPPFGPIFGTFRHFLGGRNFDRFLIDFRITFWRHDAEEAGSAEAHSESADTEESEGHRHEIPSRFTPRRGAANPKGFAHCRRPPLQASVSWLSG